MKDQTICLAGGCFWGMEALYRRLPGVTDVVCGYANGDSAAHANYEDVCTGITGFREAVQVTWDPAETSLEAMLLVYGDASRAADQKCDQGSGGQHHFISGDDGAGTLRCFPDVKNFPPGKKRRMETGKDLRLRQKMT